MQLLRTYILPRIVQWAVVIFVGVTITFLIPRFSPINPIDDMIARMTSFQTIDPAAVVSMRATMEDLYGLDGSILEQYLSFWTRLIKGIWVLLFRISPSRSAKSSPPAFPGPLVY